VAVADALQGDRRRADARPGQPPLQHGQIEWQLAADHASVSTSRFT
jgi:hypothetical protein